MQQAMIEWMNTKENYVLWLCCAFVLDKQFKLLFPTLLVNFNSTRKCDSSINPSCWNITTKWKCWHTTDGVFGSLSSLTYTWGFWVLDSMTCHKGRIHKERRKIPNICLHVNKTRRPSRELWSFSVVNFMTTFSFLGSKSTITGGGGGGVALIVTTRNHVCAWQWNEYP